MSDAPEEPTLSFDAPSSGADSGDSDVSLFSIMDKGPEMPPEGQRGDDVDDEAHEADDVELAAKEAEAEKAKETEAAAKAAELEKPEGPKRAVADDRLIGHLEKHAVRLEARNDELLRSHAGLEHRVQQYDVAVAMLQQEVEVLYGALKERGVVDERDLKLREYDMEKAYAAKMAEAQKAYDARMKTAESEISTRALAAHYSRAIPAACAEFPLVDEAQIIAAIEALPPETSGREDIRGIAKTIQERQATAWRRYQSDQRKARRDLPAPMSGKAPPHALPLNADGFQQLLERGKPGL